MDIIVKLEFIFMLVMVLVVLVDKESQALKFQEFAQRAPN